MWTCGMTRGKFSGYNIQHSRARKVSVIVDRSKKLYILNSKRREGGISISSQSIILSTQIKFKDLHFVRKNLN